MEMILIFSDDIGPLTATRGTLIILALLNKLLDQSVPLVTVRSIVSSLVLSNLDEDSTTSDLSPLGMKIKL